MILRNLISAFESIRELPIEIEEVRDALIALGVQDKIVFCPDAKMSPALRGAYYQYHKHAVPYGDAIMCSVIVYSSAQSVEWQRVIACKELMHVLDHKSEKTSTIIELDELLKRLLGRSNAEELNMFDLMALKDRLALYQAMPILFPHAARDDAQAGIKAGKFDVQFVAEKACLPRAVVGLVLTPEWPELIKDLC